ncbi:alpha/beta fold hydrolase [Desulfotruncus alcoholivorax]|uniref:alpha/beta fold hydrolase n=1 Tax=Desulfotruncus alcoholivorax TaxID=265477 RepID=UPI0004096F0C|nr:alpha/beta fold hydrolase [Desulfotruncus alcoholivorax]
MKLDDFDFKSLFIEIEGHKIHYLDEGRGEILLMLHGNPTWCYLYRNFVRQLSRDYRCIVPDFLGFGLSDKPVTADYSLQAQLKRFSLFVEKMSLTDITLISHDIGGIIGLSWAAGHKQLVKRLVVLNTRASVPAVWGLNKYIPPWSYLVLWPLRLPWLGELMVQGFNLMQNVVMPLAFVNGKAFGAQARRGIKYPYRFWRERKAQLITVRQIPILKTDPVYQLLLKTGQALNGWQVPTQIIWGLKDPSSPPALIDDIERLLPNHQPTLRLPEAGHFLTEEQPDAVLTKIYQFIKTS